MGSRVSRDGERRGRRRLVQHYCRGHHHFAPEASSSVIIIDYSDVSGALYIVRLKSKQRKGCPIQLKQYTSLALSTAEETTDFNLVTTGAQ